MEHLTTIPIKQKTFIDEFIEFTEPLYRFAYRLAGDEDVAKDLVQETYLKAYHYFDHYQLGTNAKSWLFKILNNLFLNEYNSKAKKLLTRDDKEEISDRLNSSKLTLQPEAFEDSLSDEVLLAFNALYTNLRTVLYLREVENLRYDEIAKIMDVPVSTVKTRLHRARIMFKKKLVEFGFFGSQN
ncbi:MAG: sigma-70 family RNA polymerase sigma factor [Bacteroidota bacterium]